MGAHHLKTLLQGGLMVLRGHAAIQKMGEDGMDVAQRELAAMIIRQKHQKQVSCGGSILMRIRLMIFKAIAQ